MKKVSDAELLQIKTLRESLLEIITNIGEFHLNRVILNRQLTDVTAKITEQEQRFLDFQEKERVLFEQLQQTYGTGNIDLETGEITG